MEIKGYNRWMEYPEEIDKGSLIRFGNLVVVVKDTRDIGHKLWQITFEEQTTDFEPSIHGAFTVRSDIEIETFTKFVSKV